MTNQKYNTIEEFNKRYLCDYDIIVGKGGFGEIYVGLDTINNEKVAIKRCTYDTSSKINLETEFNNNQILSKQSNVIRYKDYARFKITGVGYFEYLVMKFYPDGNLGNLAWNTLDREQQNEFLVELLEGLEHLHKNRVIHRDVKPNNILIFKYDHAGKVHYRPVITDFGLSKAIVDGEQDTKSYVQNDLTAGAISFMAPEQLKENFKISYSADIWSFGIILYQLITNKTIVARTTDAMQHRARVYDFWENIEKGVYPQEVSSMIQPYKQIIEGCLIYDPTLRFRRATQIIDLLKGETNISNSDESADGETIWKLNKPVQTDEKVPAETELYPEPKPAPIPPKPTPPHPPKPQPVVATNSTYPKNPNAGRINRESLWTFIIFGISLIGVIMVGVVSDNNRYSGYDEYAVDSTAVAVDSVAATYDDTTAALAPPPDYAVVDSAAAVVADESYGNFIFWTKELKSKNIKIYVNDELQGKITTSISEIQNCNTEGFVTCYLKSGKYKYRGVTDDGLYVWDGEIEVIGNQCMGLELTYE